MLEFILFFLLVAFIGFRIGLFFGKAMGLRKGLDLAHKIMYEAFHPNEPKP